MAVAKSITRLVDYVQPARASAPSRSFHVSNYGQCCTRRRNASPLWSAVSLLPTLANISGVVIPHLRGFGSS